MERFRERLARFQSPNDVRLLAREIAAVELDEATPAVPFVVRSVLEGLHERISDRALEVETWEQVRDSLSGPLEAVLDAYSQGERADILQQLDRLVRAWARTRAELTE